MPRSEFWLGRRVLLTGHTGFKGSWAWAWLRELGAEVTGLALVPDTEPNLFALLAADGGGRSLIGDIRDPAAVRAAVAASRPQVVIHMAAQALVRRSYAEPIPTFDVNVLGTLQVLDAVRDQPGLQACLVITSDKVYENDNSGRAFAEADRLGGSDPYSASKAACEVAFSSFVRSFAARSEAGWATARAGNVIGGGDWAPDRIVPDIWRARRARDVLLLRYPEATRPWQHVLEPIAGYLDFIEAMAGGLRVPALNFGPEDAGSITVREVVEQFQQAYGAGDHRGWAQAPGQHPKEALTLAIDPGRAKEVLPWRPRLSAAEAIAWTAQWYAAYDRGEDMAAFTRSQIAAYQER